MIYVSTGGFKNLSAHSVTKSYIEQGINHIELSGGTYSKNLLPKLKHFVGRVNFKVHNYFPPPLDPFVFNLGSLNDKILKKSIEHAKTAIEWSRELGDNTYSFHAGFLMDPDYTELGKSITPSKLYNRKDSKDLFIENVNLLAKYAHSFGVDLLIENNVFSINNFKNFKNNPFLMTDLLETVEIMNRTAKNVNLLIDVAHLKVSSNTLNYDKINYLKNVKKWIKGYHLSDNDGTRDSNDSFDEKAWFWPFIKKDLRYYSLEVYSENISLIKNQLKIFNSRVK